MDAFTRELFEDRQLNMPDMFDEGFERGGSGIFAIYQHADGSRQELSYAYLREQGLALAEKMKAFGLEKGDRVAVISTLRPWWYSLKYACLKSGYIMVCIDPGIPMQQVHSMLLQTEARAVFTTLPKVTLPEELDGRIPVCAVKEDFPVIGGAEKIDILLPSCTPLPEDTFYILFSSGTTGENRKGVLLRHETVTEAIEYGMSTDGGVYRKEPSYSVRKRDLMLFPPYHIAGLLCSTFDLYCNTQVIMLERVTPNALVGAMQELKPDNMCTVPSMLTSLRKKIVSGYSGNMFLKLLVTVLLAVSGFFRRCLGINAGRVLLRFLNRKAFGGNMKGFMVGASPCDEETNRFFLDMGIDVAMAYGLTELGAPLAVTGKGYYPGTTGRVIRHTDKLDIRIVNPDENGRGEVEVLSPYRMISYLRESDMDGVFTEDGYFRTGDLGYFDKQDCLVICGRAKECMVLRNGEKLLPEEIEAQYQGFSDVAEIAAFRVPGDGGCDAFSLAAVKTKGCPIPNDAVKQKITDRAASLPGMYQPKDVYILRELPLSSSHKVQRFRLTEMAAEGSSAPVTEASLRTVDEDSLVSALRAMLVSAGGTQWQTAELTEGTLLNLDSLQAIDFFVNLQDRFGIDMFQLSQPPETFGALLDAVRNYDTEDKKSSGRLDLSKYPEKVGRGEKIFYTGVEKFIKLLWGVQAAGQENLPDEPGFLICANHRTVLDPAFILCDLPRKVIENTCVIGKADLAENKMLKDFCRSHNFIPIDRSGNSVPTLDRCRELLLQGWNVVIFPEGTNYENNEVMFPFKEGAARLALSTGCRVVPCFISGVAHIDKEVNNFVLPPTRGKISVTFGPAFSSEGTDVRTLTAKMRSAIEALQDAKREEEQAAGNE